MGVLLLLLLALQPPASCPDAAACRAAAESAAARGDYEAFHDFAWRAVQTGKANDPPLMLLLARAQSLSGRPDDALVMLGRLTDMGVSVDLTLADFDRARQLAGWAALVARLPGAGTRSVAPGSTSSTGPPAAAPPAPAAPPPSAAANTLEFDAPPGLDPVALAHDAVSRRFVVGDAPSRRLLVIDEVSTHVVPYVSAGSAGFYDELTALTLDARRGDLWVASAQGTAGAAASIVHKLQLVSGRGLMEARPAESLQPVRIVDLAVAPEGTVFALDAAGGRLFRLRPGSRTLEIAMKIAAPNPTALAAVDDRTLFVASDRGLLRVDLASRGVQPVKSVEDLSGFRSLAWRNGALIGVQRAQGVSLAVRVAIEAGGTRAAPRAILAASAQPLVGAVTGGSFYYLVSGVIHRVALR